MENLHESRRPVAYEELQATITGVTEIMDGVNVVPVVVANKVESILGEPIFDREVCMNIRVDDLESTGVELKPGQSFWFWGNPKAETPEDLHPVDYGAVPTLNDDDRRMLALLEQARLENDFGQPL